MLASLARCSLLGVDRSRLRPFTKCERSLNVMLTVSAKLTQPKKRNLQGELFVDTGCCPLSHDAVCCANKTTCCSRGFICPDEHSTRCVPPVRTCPKDPLTNITTSQPAPTLPPLLSTTAQAQANRERFSYDAVPLIRSW